MGDTKMRSLWALPWAAMACTTTVVEGDGAGADSVGAESASIEESCRAICTAPRISECYWHEGSTTACMDSCVVSGKGGCEDGWAALAGCVVNALEPQDNPCELVYYGGPCDAEAHAFSHCIGDE